MVLLGFQIKFDCYFIFPRNKNGKCLSFSCDEQLHIVSIDMMIRWNPKIIASVISTKKKTGKSFQCTLNERKIGNERLITLFLGECVCVLRAAKHIR